MNKKRKEELLTLATRVLNDKSYFDYYDWDGFIECDEELTVDELDWLRENAVVRVLVDEA